MSPLNRLTSRAGRAAGPKTPSQDGGGFEARYDSAASETSGIPPKRLPSTTASTLTLQERTTGSAVAPNPMATSTSPVITACIEPHAALVGNVGHFRAGELLDLLAGEVVGGAEAGRAVEPVMNLRQVE